ncbi:MAG: glutathione S-transferase C-terminal domain-containing protein, partial [Clostridia bacterium]|nr:glutathione S-transferase C-terminal domain-containing protein [Clostridia bacterium]
NHQDAATGAYFLSEFYANANPDYRGRATTPTFVDIKEKKAVNNDYHRLTNYIEVQFRAFQSPDAPDLYPKKFREEIDEFNDWLFPHVNNGHYRMAFCSSIEAYNEAYADFYESLDKLEERLSKNRFLFGDYVTDSDIRLYVTLVRWDTGYYRNIGPTKHRIVDYPNLWGYVRDLYEIPAFQKTTFFPRKPEGEDARLFRDFNSRLAWQIDYKALYATDGARRLLSQTPDEKFLRHPESETAEDYQSEISFSHWNLPGEKDRDPSLPENSPLRADASINPIDLHQAYT